MFSEIGIISAAQYKNEFSLFLYFEVLKVLQNIFKHYIYIYIYIYTYGLSMVELILND